MGWVVMTKEDILKIAQECNLIGMRPHLDGIYSESLERFARLVAEHEREAFIVHAMTIAKKAIDVAMKLEREACAKMCDYVYDNIVTDEHIKAMAFKIRARGQE